MNKIYNLLKKEINHRMKFMKGFDSDDEELIESEITESESDD